MKRNHYFENYLNNLQKEIFLIAYNSKYDVLEFISCYMKSDLRKEMDEIYSYWHLSNALRIFQEVISIYNIPLKDNSYINVDSIEWLGYFYSSWHHLTKESSKTIVRFLPPKEGIKNYYVLHQLDETKAIELTKQNFNKKKNIHRKNETKIYKDINLLDESNLFYSLLCARILYKLTKDYKYNNLNYVGDINDYILLDNELSLGVIGEQYKQFGVIGDFQTFLLKSNVIKDGSFEPERSIYFCYIKEEENVDVDSLLNKIRNEMPLEERRYNYIYHYHKGRLTELNNINEINEYYLTVTNKDIKGIQNKMNKMLDK